MLQDHATSVDALLGGRVKIEQPVQGYRSGIDPVLLAAAVPAKPGEHVLELGIGAGAAALCLLARIDGVCITGVERDQKFAKLARSNAALNKMEDGLKIVEGEVGNEPGFGLFDHVFMNPPYHDSKRHDKGAAASHMAEDELPAWINYAFRHLKDGGTCTLIHRADALAKIIGALAALPAGAVKILPIVSHAGEPAKRVIVSAVKGRKTPLTLLSPLVVHKADGGYEDLCRSILEGTRAL
jgi:tRNA1(Val) A37 N6-methylase TrmN6